MLFLKLRFDQPASKKIDCLFRNAQGAPGNMHVQFLNDVHAHTGPYLSFDNTIRGFGIPHQQFKPAFDTFTFVDQGKYGVLDCKGKNYAFSLRFEKP